MSFTTALFWFFILIGVVIYYVLPSKVRWMWLLVLSYLYYFSFNVKNSLFMVAASLVIYLAALAMEYIQDKSDAYLKEHTAATTPAAKPFTLLLPKPFTLLLLVIFN